MRAIVLAIVAAAGMCLMAVAGASAAPANGPALAGIANQSSQVIHVSGGCGPHRHRGPHGHCHHD